MSQSTCRPINQDGHRLRISFGGSEICTLTHLVVGGMHILSTNPYMAVYLDHPGGIHVVGFVGNTDIGRGLDDSDLGIPEQDGVLASSAMVTFESRYALTLALLYRRVVDQSGQEQHCIFAGSIPAKYADAFDAGQFTVAGFDGWRPSALSAEDRAALAEEVKLCEEPGLVARAA